MLRSYFCAHLVLHQYHVKQLCFCFFHVHVLLWNWFDVSKLHKWLPEDLLLIRMWIQLLFYNDKLIFLSPSVSDGRRYEPRQIKVPFYTLKKVLYQYNYAEVSRVRRWRVLKISFLFLSSLADNGLNPTWSRKSYKFTVCNSAFAFLRFVVYEIDMFSDQNFLAQATFPIQGLKTGMCSDVFSVLQSSFLCVAYWCSN